MQFLHGIFVGGFLLPCIEHFHAIFPCDDALYGICQDKPNGDRQRFEDSFGVKIQLGFECERFRYDLGMPNISINAFVASHVSVSSEEVSHAYEVLTDPVQREERVKTHCSVA